MNDGWCVECGDEFHDDDTGGYNPECQCCGLCRSCCPKNPNNGDPDDDYERPETILCAKCGRECEPINDSDTPVTECVICKPGAAPQGETE